MLTQSDLLALTKVHTASSLETCQILLGKLGSICIIAENLCQLKCCCHSKDETRVNNVQLFPKIAILIICNEKSENAKEAESLFNPNA